MIVKLKVPERAKSVPYGEIKIGVDYPDGTVSVPLYMVPAMIAGGCLLIETGVHVDEPAKARIGNLRAVDSSDPASSAKAVRAELATADFQALSYYAKAHAIPHYQDPKTGKLSDHHTTVPAVRHFHVVRADTGRQVGAVHMRERFAKDEANRLAANDKAAHSVKPVEVEPMRIAVGRPLDDLRAEILAHFDSQKT